MAAHLLDAARVGEFRNVYRLGEHLQPITIRDQLVRAWLVTGELLDRGLVGADRPLLVVGAGVAGVTAAARALKAGCRVHLIEREPEPFDTQRFCTTRVVEPFGNDWPHTHFDKIIPPDGVSPLEFDVTDADGMAARWGNQFNALLGAYEDGRRTLRYRPGVEFAFDPAGVCDVDEDGTSVQYRPDGTTYGAALLCTGFGKADYGFGRYVGFPFWEDDPLGDPRCGLPEGLTRPSILVSGGGYGGLQDFVRCLIGNVAISQAFSRLSIPSAVRLRLLTAYETAYRTMVTFGLHRERRHMTWQPVRDEVDAAVAGMRTTREWPALMDQVGRLIPADRPRVYLAHSCGHFGESFVGWRFLVRLLAEHLRARAADAYDPLIPKVHLAGVKCVGHAPGDPFLCHGRRHEVTFAHTECGKPKPVTPPRPFEFDGVVIRHGPAEAGVARLFQPLPFKLG